MLLVVVLELSVGVVCLRYVLLVVKGVCVSCLLFGQIVLVVD